MILSKEKRYLFYVVSFIDLKFERKSEKVKYFREIYHISSLRFISIQ